MFKYLISINPLGFMYGSSGAFLSPENLVGRSGTKFPPEAATLSGLIFSINKIQQSFTQDELRENLVVAGAFWAKRNHKQNFYVPIPWHKIIAEKDVDEWYLESGEWQREQRDDKLEPDYQWQTISTWKHNAKALKNTKTSVAANPWKFTSFLHPDIQQQQRCVKNKDGLFLENAVQIPDDTCLIYLSTYPIENGWYSFGGENHIVEIECDPLKDIALDILNKPIERAFALIVPGVWGSTRFSYRYPQHQDFPKPKWMLTDKPIPYRYRAKKQLGRGRYAVPAGSVFVLEKPLNQTWWEWDKAWFPTEGISLKQMGCGLCLPIEVKGIE
ncbi:CRISPR-associated protein [Brunnivagina elsteri]|uniref:CRISPR-associated protein n=1 Tax=Brunnivagina elsteri CCALA 953 TaxID=987040 RepID=A0A2A2TB31_9CYAN|nr:CRISPR-associated protein [Calothrix elsteri]PAX49830.1 CRISPR-associated protein [Calothrix elsteri CCALA 953]